jgi:hypothetical protein
MTFSNGGYYRGGRYDGWDGADRINARYHGANHPMRDDERQDGFARCVRTVTRN